MYKTRLLIAAALCAAVVTLFGAATIGAQAPASAPAAKADKKGGPLFSVSHDATLQGDGTTESPLGITESPTVSGSLTVTGDIQADRISSRFTAITDGLTIQGPTQASTTTGNAVEARGGDSNRTPGSGFSGTGGTGLGNAFGGAGVTGIGGVSQTSLGGEGLLGIGGAGAEAGGNGVLGLGAIPGGFGLVGVGATGNERGGE